jgi:DNA-binding NarL/FixJ family response regulator
VVPTPILRLDDQDEPIRALEPIDRGGLKQATLDARTALQEAAIAAAVAAERALAYAETLDGALAALHRAETAESGLPSSMSPRGGLPSAVLSRREQEVLALVAEGRTNKAIADELFLSPNTVKTHVASLLNKLHADSRAQLAAMAVRGTAR